MEAGMEIDISIMVRKQINGDFDIIKDVVNRKDVRILRIDSLNKNREIKNLNIDTKNNKKV